MYSIATCEYAVALATGRINGTDYQWLVPKKVKERLSWFDGLGCCSRRQYMWPCKKAGCDTTTSSPTLFFGLFCSFQSGQAYPAQPYWFLFIYLLVRLLIYLFISVITRAVRHNTVCVTWAGQHVQPYLWRRTVCRGLSGDGKWWGGSRRDTRGDGRPKTDVCVSWTAEAKPNTKLGNGPAHDLSMALCRYLSIFAEKRLSCQGKFHIVEDEVRQSPIMLESSASCPAVVSSALQDYSGIIWPSNSVTREGLLKEKTFNAFGVSMEVGPD